MERGQIEGAKFRQQTWIGPFLVDLYCADAKLVIEVDGDTHAHQQDYDTRRTAWIENEGFKVIRFSNDDVMRNLEGVVAVIRDALRPSPSHRFAAGPHRVNSAPRCLGHAGGMTDPMRLSPSGRGEE